MDVSLSVVERAALYAARTRLPTRRRSGNFSMEAVAAQRRRLKFPRRLPIIQSSIPRSGVTTT
jgi:hypothetical protein